ncbi:MAG: site-specific integrase [Deltaproteobacteria bacterium]|nr:site-specific integrase [Deltaproteobacteria bacterium]
MKLWRNPRDGYYHIRQGQKRKALGTKDPDVADLAFTNFKKLSFEDQVEQLEGYSRLRISEFRDRYIAARKDRAKDTLRADKYAFGKLISHAGDKLMASVSREDVTGLLSSLSDAGRKRNTVNNVGRHLRAAFNEAIEWEILKTNPLRKVKLKRAILPAPPLVIDKKRRALLKACELLAKEQPRFQDFGRFIEVLLALGLRRIELVRMTWGDVRETSVVIHGKGDRYREIPLTKATGALLGKRGKDGEFVFPRWRDPNTITRMFREVAKKARCKGITPHTLRHTTETQLAIAGVDLQGRMAMLGHSTVEMALRYTHISQEQLLQALNRIEGESRKKGGGKNVNMPKVRRNEGYH